MFLILLEQHVKVFVLESSMSADPLLWIIRAHQVDQIDRVFGYSRHEFCYADSFFRLETVPYISTFSIKTQISLLF